MTFSFGDLLTDVKESRYFQVWGIFWVAFAVVFFVALGNIVSYSNQVNDGRGGFYRFGTYDYSQEGIRFPRLQLSTLSPQDSINPDLTFCSDSAERIINHTAGKLPTTGQDALNVLSDAAIASPPKPYFVCMVQVNINNPNVSKRMRLSFAAGDDFAGGETIYLRSDEVVTVMLEHELFASDVSGSKSSIQRSLFNPWGFDNKQNNNNGTVMLTVQFQNFNTPVYAAFNPSSSWLAVSDVGGALMFVYALHSLLMFSIGLLLTNDSRVLGGARTSYTAV